MNSEIRQLLWLWYYDAFMDCAKKQKDQCSLIPNSILLWTGSFLWIQKRERKQCSLIHARFKLIKNLLDDYLELWNLPAISELKKFIYTKFFTVYGSLECLILILFFTTFCGNIFLNNDCSAKVKLELVLLNSLQFSLISTVIFPKKTQWSWSVSCTVHVYCTTWSPKEHGCVSSALSWYVMFTSFLHHLITMSSSGSLFGLIPSVFPRIADFVGACYEKHTKTYHIKSVHRQQHTCKLAFVFLNRLLHSHIHCGDPRKL